MPPAFRWQVTSNVIHMHSSEAQFENFQALSFVQSALGALSHNFRSLSIQCSNGQVDLYYVLENDSPGDREEIGDIEAEMYSHQNNGSIVINSHIKIFSGSRNFEEMIVGRPIYLRKESNG